MTSIRAVRLVTAMAGVALAAGCGTNVCTRAQKTYDKVNSKIGTCDYKPFAFNTTTCDNGEKSCTDNDRTTINRVFDCYDKVSSCNPDQQNAWEGAIKDCNTNSDVTEACSAAIAAK